ncbi:MAG: sugar transferase, partial [Terriglobales bacterium]
GTHGWARRLLAAFPGGWASVDAGMRRELMRAGCRLEEGAAWYERLSGKVLLSAPLEVRCRARATERIKRIGDAAVAGSALLACWPLLLATAALIRLDSPGPALFRQERVGQFGRSFTIYKFRTMFHGAASRRNVPAAAHDPRCTRVGRWLRRLRLDELPQLWNIVRGEMSLVGPRPFVLDQEQECCHAIAGYTQRWRVPPGATGWAQVNRGYCATLEDNREKLAYDLFYIQHLSLWFDALIVLQTLKVVCLGRGGR